MSGLGGSVSRQYDRAGGLGGVISPEYGTLNVMQEGIGAIRSAGDDAPAPAPAPVTMPTIDSETIRRARLRAMRRMVAQNQGRESTILGGANNNLGGTNNPAPATGS
jgi:hypothetical protein